MKSHLRGSYGEILKTQTSGLIVFDNCLTPETLAEIFPTDNIVYVNSIPPEDLLERYDCQQDDYFKGIRGRRDIFEENFRLVYVNPTPLTEIPTSGHERIEYVKNATAKSLAQRFPDERLVYINIVIPELLAIMSPSERYHIKSMLTYRAHSRDNFDLQLFANTAIPFFTIPLEVSFDTDGWTLEHVYSLIIGISKLGNRLFRVKPRIETEITNECFGNLNFFQQEYRERILNLDPNDYEDKWMRILQAFLLSNEIVSCVPVTKGNCFSDFEEYVQYPTIRFLELAGRQIRIDHFVRIKDETSEVKIVGRPDVVYSENGEPLFFLDSLGPDFSNLVKDGIQTWNNDFKLIMRNFCTNFIVCKVTRGIITNFHHTLFLEIDEGDLDKMAKCNDTEVEVSFRYRLFTLKDMCITVQAAFLSWLYSEGSPEEELGKERQKETICVFKEALVVKPEEEADFRRAAIKEVLVEETNARAKIDSRKSLFQVTGQCESWSGFEVLRGWNFSGDGILRKVYKFRVDLLCQFFPFFKQVLSDKRPGDLVVMKLYIPEVVSKAYGLGEALIDLEVICIQSFLREANCYELIAKHNSEVVDEQDKIHTPTMYYYEGFRMAVKEQKPIVGYYLLLSYVEGSETELSEAVIEKGCRQIEMMGGIGIKHDDVGMKLCKVINDNFIFLNFSYTKNQEQRYEVFKEVRVFKSHWEPEMGLVED